MHLCLHVVLISDNNGENRRLCEKGTVMVSITILSNFRGRNNAEGILPLRP